MTGNRVPRLQIDGLSQLWIKEAVEDAMLVEECGTEELVCQKCGKVKL
jgi:hypothetical protein